MNKVVDGEFEIVWLDQQLTQNVTEPDVLNRRVDLDEYFTCLHVVNSVEACFNHLSILDFAEKVLLIVSGSLGESTLSLVHERTQIISVFVFCADVVKHREWASKYKKVRGVFDTAHDLVEAIQRDAQLLMHHFIPANIFTMQDVHQTSFQNIDKQQANFMWFQLLIDALARLPQSDQGKRELIDECRRCYTNNEAERNKITEFENTYTSEEAVRWYTRDCFLFRLINRAFRTRNIDNIFKFRYFFVDLQQQLAHLHSSQERSSSSRIVYRGQIISSDELNKIKQNQGGIYCVNTFLSTSIGSDVALSFNVGAFVRPYFERVLFEIHINDQADKQWKIPFAYIQGASFNQHENEVLLSIGSMFRIEEVDLWNDDLWLVQLTLLEHSGLDETLREYLLAKEVGEQSTLLVLSNLLYRMGEINRAKRFCELLLREDSLPNNMKMQGYSDLAYYQYKLGDLSAAESSCESALKLQLSIDCFSAATCGLMGLIAAAHHDYRRALYFQKLAVDKIRSSRLQENESVAVLYGNLGMAWMDLGQAIPALYWCEQMALPCQLKLLPPNHPDLLVTYTNIAEIYLSIGKFSKSRVYSLKALDIQKQILPPFHIDVAGTLYNLSRVCEEIGEYKNALNYLHEAQRITLHSGSYDHTDMVPSYLGMAAVYEHLNKDRKSLKCYKKLLRVYQ